MKTTHREHPLGTPGLSARLKAGSAGSTPVHRWLSNLFPGLAGESASWLKGAKGEEFVGKRLAKLSREDWMPLHDRPLGNRGRNVDHLVIGRGGVFTVNTKNLSGNAVVKGNTFRVSGYCNRSILHAARDEAVKVGERLSLASGVTFEAIPVLVVLTPSLEVHEQPEGVHVLGRSDVPSWFEDHPPALERAEAARIYQASRRNAVWTQPLSSLRAAASPSGVTTNEWRRFGHQRVYVNDANGASLGYLDRKTREICVEDVDRSDQLIEALQPYLGDRRGEVSPRGRACP